MTAQLLASELANLIQESKRKHNDLRQVIPFIPSLPAAHCINTVPSISHEHLPVLHSN